MKRSLMILLTACLLLSTLASCGDSSNTPSQTSGNVISGDQTDTSYVADTSDADVISGENPGDSTESTGTASTGQTSTQQGTNSKNNTSTGGNSATASATPSTVNLRTATFKGVTLKRIRWYDMGSEETQMIKDWEKKTGAKIQDVYVNYENIQDKIKQSIAAKDPIDIGFLYGAFFPTDIIANMYKPVDSYIQNQYLLDTNNLSNGGFDLSKMNEYKWKNHYYGFCSYWDVDMLVMYYRKDVFKDYNLTDPNTLAQQGRWNWDTFYQAAEKIQKGGEINGYSNGPDGKGGHQNIWILGAGSSPIINTSTKPTINFSDSKFVKGMEFYQKITSGATAVVDSEHTFQDGKAAMFIGGLYDATKLMTNSKVPSIVKNNWDIAPVPVSSSNKTGKYPTDWLKAVGIVNGSKNADAVASFALYKSKYKGDNKYDDYFTDAQKSRIVPYFKSIAYANYGYGNMIVKYGQLFAQVASGDNISQVLSANKSVFQTEIDKTIRK